MSQALISPNEQAQNYNWVSNDKGGWNAEWYFIPNSERIAEVSVTPFEVSPPLFWTQCSSDVVADQWYYDNTNQQIIQIVNPPMPVAEAQTVTATTTGTGGPNVVA
jgi:hypothetical protein